MTCRFGEQSTWAAHSLTLPVTQDALPNGATDVFYLSSHLFPWYEPTQAEVDAGTYHKLVVDSAVSTITFSGLEAGRVWYISGFRKDGATVTRWLYPNNAAVRRPQMVTLDDWYTPVTLDELYVEDWSQGWSGWMSETAQAPPTDAFWHNTKDGKNYAFVLYDYTDPAEADPAPFGTDAYPRGENSSMRVSRQAWRTDKPLTIEYDAALWEWSGARGADAETQIAELGGYKNVTTMMHGENGYGSWLLDTATTSENPIGINPWGLAVLNHEDSFHAKLVDLGSAPDATAGRFGNAMVAGTRRAYFNGTEVPVGFMADHHYAGYLGAPQFFWMGAYQLLRGEMTFKGTPLYYAASSHLHFFTWGGEFAVLMPHLENSPVVAAGLAPPSQLGNRWQQSWGWLGGSDSNYLVQNGAWQAQSPKFAAVAGNPWVRLVYAGQQRTGSTMTLSVVDADTQDVLTTSSPTMNAAPARYEVDLSPYEGHNLQVLVGGTDMNTTTRGVEGAGVNEVQNLTAILNYMYVETEVTPAPRMYDLADAFLPATADVSFGVSVAEGASATMVAPTGAAFGATVADSAGAAKVAPTGAAFGATVAQSAGASVQTDTSRHYDLADAFLPALPVILDGSFAAGATVGAGIGALRVAPVGMAAGTAVGIRIYARNSVAHHGEDLHESEPHRRITIDATEPVVRQLGSG